MDSITLESTFNQMMKTQDPQLLQDALQLLQKLTTNITQNPTDVRFRSLKLSNKTLHSRLFNVEGINRVLNLIGFELRADEYFLPDQNLGLLFGHLDELRWAGLLADAQLSGPSEVEKAKEIIAQQKLVQAKREQETKQKQQIQQQAEYDKQERKLVKAKDSVAKEAKFGAQVKRCEDIGIGKNQGG
ncbi:hypothetical protein pb186bvf_020272 [Paramecium bursaria]